PRRGGRRLGGRRLRRDRVGARPRRRGGRAPTREGGVRCADGVGHGRAIERLRRAAAADRLAPAYLLAGPPGIGKRLVADAFAARILCAAPVAGDACQACAQCTRVAAGTHPDLRSVERDEERRDIRIEQVRELSRWLAPQPLMVARGVAAERAALLAAEAEGSPGRAIALSGDEEARARGAVLEALPALGTLGAAALSALAQELARGPAEAALGATAAWYRDVLETALTGDPPRRNPDAAAAVRAAADRSPPARALRQL